MTHAPTKTRRKVNKDLFNQCVAELGCSPYQVIIMLLNRLNEDFSILEVTPEISGEYMYKDVYVDNVKYYTFAVILETDVGYSIKGWQAIDILMYNFLNQN
jgi:hypothetical protein